MRSTLLIIAIRLSLGLEWPEDSYHLRCRGAKFATLKRVPLAWRLVEADYFLRIEDSGSLVLYILLSCLKNSDKGPASWIELSPEISERNLDQVWYIDIRGLSGSHFLSMAQQRICFSVSMAIAFLPFEIPNHYPNSFLVCLFLAEDGI